MNLITPVGTIEGSPNEQTVKPITVGEMVQKYFDWKDMGVSSEHTKRAYHYEIARLMQYVGKDAHAESLNRFSLHAFAQQLHDAGLAPRTRRRALSYARDLVRWARDAGIYAENFAQTTGLPRIPKTMPEVPTEAQMQVMLDTAPATGWPSRDRCIAELLYCNLRVCEVTAINLEDITGDDLLVHGKGKRERKAFFTPSAKIALSLYLPDRERFLGRRGIESEVLFVNQRNCRRITVKSVHRIIKGMAYSAGLPKYVSPVKLRAACATHLLDNGAALSAVSQLLGHERIATTMHYVGAVSPRRMRESYDQTFKR
jgi:integrase/recombinase XerC